MPRSLPLTALAILALLAGPALARAQSADGKFEITQVRLGFPPGVHSGDPDGLGIQEPVLKTGSWAPVLVDVTCLAPPSDPTKAIELVVETTDADDDRSLYPVPLSAFQPGEQRTVMAYTKPGNELPEVSVYVRDAARRQQLGEPYTFTVTRTLDASRYLYLTLGARLPGFRLPGVTEQARQQSSAQRRSEMATLLAVRELPTEAKGYDGVDLAVLATGNVEFVRDLQSDRRARAALIDWVRQGGRLVVSVGSNQSLVAPIDDLAKLLPVQFKEGDRSSAGLTVSWSEVGSAPLRQALGAADAKWLAAFDLKTDRPLRVLMAGRTGAPMSGRGGGTERPLVVQAPYGLGRVTFVGFDLDAKPFAAWGEQPAFWERLLPEAGPHLPVVTAEPAAGFGGRGRGVPVAGGDDPLTRLQNSLEYFEGVPVIGFAWVALFIFIYILIVGPLDYLILKKVFKRLELTWVTFPVVVLTVSGLAYFAAYALKGQELKVNKIDLVEFDLRGRETFGTSWFAVFSPRIQSYTIGVEPAGGWAARTGEAPPTVSWLGQTKNVQRSLFRRSYQYAEHAEGLLDVPIQVWSTKVFVGQWHASFDPAAAPFTAELRGDGLNLVGAVTNNLPADLSDVVLVYADRAYQIGTLRAGQRLPVTKTEQRFPAWLQTVGTAVRSPDDRRDDAPPRYSPWPALFHEVLDTSTRQGAASLRELDQSWRLNPDFRTEVVLLARVAEKGGAADAVNKDAATPTRLWLGALPQAGGEPPAIPGTLRQETYVRAYLPVRATGARPGAR